MDAIARPSEFDVHFQLDRARRLRRRFLWFCSVNLLLTCMGLFFGVAVAGAHNPAKLGAANWIDLASMVLGVALFTSAIVYAARAAPGRSDVLNVAFWVVVLAGAVEVVGDRVAAQFYHRDVTAATAVATTTVTTKAAPQERFAGDDTPAPLANIFMIHFFACLFLPWTLRESLRPAAVLLALVVPIALFDVLVGAAPARTLTRLPLAPLVVVPGALICWWRFSRLRKNARLHFESSGYKKLQTELAGARRIHDTCMPRPVTDGPVRLHYAYEPMRQIGGDLLFVPERGADDDLLAVLLDVTGHGIAAALTVNRIVGELERLVAERPGVAPGELIASLNRYVHLTLGRHGLYVTALCVRVEAGGTALAWASAGHPPALLRRSDGQVERLDSNAMMLGVLAPSDFAAETSRAALEPGDVLVAYTDGAAEARDRDGRMFAHAGIERLVAAGDGAPPHWPAQMLRAVTAHRFGLPDDDTLILALFRA